MVNKGILSQREKHKGERENFFLTGIYPYKSIDFFFVYIIFFIPLLIFEISILLLLFSLVVKLFFKTTQRYGSIVRF